MHHNDIIDSLSYKIYAIAIGGGKQVKIAIDPVESVDIETTMAHRGTQDEIPLQQKIAISGLLKSIKELKSEPTNNITWDDILNGVNKKEE